MTVVRALLAGHAGWLALVVALNAVLGLAYYLRLAATLYAAPGPATARPARMVVVVLGAATALAVVVGFAPQLVLELAAR